MPVGPRLARWYGTSELCKLLYSKPYVANGKIGDFTDGDQYKSWYEEGNIFSNSEEAETVPLALFCDGLNPNRSMATQKSMWPLILTWLNLPIHVRTLLGPMMLVGIIPGTKTEEPKHLDPYIDVLVDELLSLTNLTVMNSYKKAPTHIKVALLQYQCDIPAFSKLLHVSGQAAIRGCPYCSEKGVYCQQLHKVIHVSNRQFLPQLHPLRKDCTKFAEKGPELRPPPQPYSLEEEIGIRNHYEQLPNKSQKQKAQKETGFKGRYSLMRLPFHNRGEQMQPDGMHTIADVVSNVFDMVSGKDDTKNVRITEEKYSRFESTWLSKAGQTNSNKRKRDAVGSPTSNHKKAKTDEEETAKPKAPWSLDKEGLAKADERAKSLLYPAGFDYHPDAHFTKPWTLRTMHGKLQVQFCF